MKKNLEEMQVKVANKRAILESHDGEEFSLITVAKNVLCEDGTTMQDYFDSHSEPNISTKIVNSNSMSKVGQGDNVDFSDNVMNGAYEDVVLKGKSLVNVIQEPSSQDVVLPYAFEDGQYVTINDTKEGGALGVELKGQTLVNLIDYSNPLNEYITKDNDTLTVISQRELGWFNGAYKLIGVAYEKKYRVMWDSLTYTHTDSHGAEQIIGIYSLDSNNKQVTIAYNRNDNSNYFEFTVPSNTKIESVTIRIHATTYSGKQGDTTTVKGLKVLEYQQGMENWDIPYFEGMQSVKMPTLHTVGKNLFDINKCINGKSINDNGELIDGRSHQYATKEFIKIDNTITISVVSDDGVVSDTANGTRLRFYDKNKKLISSNWFAGGVQIQGGRKKRTFTVDGAEYLRLNISASGGNADTTYEAMTTIQIENGSLMTSYEPHKSSILSTPSDLILRGIGDVQDTLNCLTGEVTERIGEVVLDGSQNLDIQFNTNSQQPNTAFVQYIDSRFEKGGAISCNLPKANGDLWGVSSYDNQFVFNYLYYNENNKKIQILIPYSMLKTIDISGVKQFLSENPIKILLPIKESIKTVDLKVADQKGDVIPTLKSWNTTTHIYSEIPENSLYPILSHSNPSYPVILKPSTKYSIVANSYSNNHTNSAINFNLGGATATTTVGNRVTTITTPSTLSNELLTMSGRGNKLNNVMVIEGDVVGDEPYFEGMCDSKSPILSNIGETILETPFEKEFGTDAQKEFFRIVDCAEIFDNFGVGKQYTLSLDIKANKSGAARIYLQNGSGSRHNFSFDIPVTTEYVRHTKQITPTMAGDGHNFKESWLACFTTYNTGCFATIKNIRISTGEDEPYKSNILSCNGDKINLTEDMFEQGTTGEFSVNIGATYHSFKSDSNNRIRTKEIVKVKPNTTYSVICNNGYTARIAGFDINGLCLSEIKSFSSNTTIITTSNNVHYICVILSKISGSISTLDFLQSGLEIREVDKTIVLRSLPNGVCDTLNVKTGEYVQNVGEFILDGNEDEIYSKEVLSNGIVRFNFSGNTNNIANRSKPFGTLICDKLTTSNRDIDNLDYVRIHSSNGGFWIYQANKNIDENELKNILNVTPLEIQYELAEPITKTVDISGYPYAYENGHVLLESGSIEQSLTPTIEYSIVANRGGQIRSNQRMIERHQKKLDSLYAMTLVNMIDSQYKQALMELKSDLPKSEVRTWDIE